jgi:hypothetical protein
MTATLKVVFRDSPRTITEHHPDTCAAGEAVAALAAQLAAEITPGPVTSGRTGFLTADQDIDAPIRMSRIVAEYEIVED